MALSILRALALTGIVAAVLLGSGPAHAACTGASPTWTCSGTTGWSDMKALVEGASIQTGDTVTLAAGTYSGVTAGITIPSSKRLTVRGVSAASTIVSTASAITFIGIGTSQSRVSAFTFSTSNSGAKIITAQHTGWRFDNNIVDYRPSGSKGYAVYYENRNCYYPTCTIGGLVDNNTFYEGRILVNGSALALSASALAFHATATGLGSAVAVYIEDNTFVNTVFGNFIDANSSGAYVVRFNTFTRATTVTGSIVEAHGLASLTLRATKKWEIYLNTMTYAGGETMLLRAGTGVVWGNTVNASGAGLRQIRMDNRRDAETTCLCNGSCPDFDSNDLADGWLCRDQIGSGQDVTAFDGTLPLPAQAKEPAYFWSNGITSGVTASSHVVTNRDFYDYSAATGSPQLVGTRVGTKVNMPAGCTTGVGYWVTNEGYWNTTTPGVADGQLYKCTASNTWTLYYIPYTYPHPLRSGVDPEPPDDPPVDPPIEPPADAPAGTVSGISFGGVTW